MKAANLNNFPILPEAPTGNMTSDILTWHFQGKFHVKCVLGDSPMRLAQRDSTWVFFFFFWTCEILVYQTHLDVEILKGER